jgi:hypothetical protein
MRHLRFGSMCVAAALLGCGDDLVLPPEGNPATITIIQGDGLSGRVGEALADSLIVEVLDGTDRPVQAATVVVELTGAVADPDTITTDQLGRASAEITLGGVVGEASGAARVIAPESSVEVEARFTVTALASSANGLAAVSGDGQSGPVGTELVDPLVVEVTDAFGNAIAGVTITWTAEGGGSVSEASNTTDAQGRASVTRTLGPAAGPQTTVAASEGLAGSPVVFGHTATAGSASGVQIVSGNEQIGGPGETLPEPLVVAVVDESGNPVVGTAVAWLVTAGGGAVDPETSNTDAAGRASTSWTLGAAAGTNTVQAIVSGVGQAEFTATATAGTPSRLRIVSGDNQSGVAGSPLAAQLVVEVLDDVDNPVSGATVNWSVQSGNGSVSPTSGQTDAAGRAAASWTLGPGTGNQQVQASVSGAGSVRFDATATPGAAAALALRIQPSSTAQVGVPFNRQPEIQVRDAAGNPVQAAGVSITAAIATGPGQLGGTRTVTTGSNGRVRFTDLEINGAAGSHTLIFSASGLQSVTSNAITVSPVGTTTQITSDTPDPSAPGENVTVAFQVTSPGGTPTGTVQVTASGGPETCTAEVSAGQCVITLTVEGSRTLTASYQGSSTFQSSDDNEAHNVVTPDSPPTAEDDNFSATRGVTLSVPAPGVLGNDGDVDGDAMSAALVPDTGPERGTLTFRSDGSFDYTPSSFFFGQDSFQYEVTAGGATDRATVRIIVN